MKLDRIADMTQGDLRRFIVNLMQSDPGALPRHLQASETLPNAPHTDSDVPVWDASSNKWVASSQHKIPYAQLSLVGGIVNADIAAGAAIAITKLAGGFVLNRVVTITAGAAFVPTAGTRALFVECVGGGGGGGGCALTAAGQVAGGGGGGGGAYSSTWLTANIGGSCTIQIGGGGAGGVAGANNGAVGGDTFFQNTVPTTVCLAKGGSAGLGSAAVAAFPTGTASGVSGGAAASGTGDWTASGGGSTAAFALSVGWVVRGVGGAGTGLGAGPAPVGFNGGAGAAGLQFGGGGGGAANLASQAAGLAGGTGAAGAIRVWEFL